MKHKHRITRILTLILFTHSTLFAYQTEVFSWSFFFGLRFIIYASRRWRAAWRMLTILLWTSKTPRRRHQNSLGCKMRNSIAVTAVVSLDWKDEFSRPRLDDKFKGVNEARSAECVIFGFWYARSHISTFCVLFLGFSQFAFNIQPQCNSKTFVLHDCNSRKKKKLQPQKQEHREKACSLPCYRSVHNTPVTVAISLNKPKTNRRVNMEDNSLWENI